MTGFGGDKKGGKFEFANANPLWRASLDIIDFMPLLSVDYGGGLIITDWYGEENENDSIKISIQFLSNEIRSDALNIKVFTKPAFVAAYFLSLHISCGIISILELKLLNKFLIVPCTCFFFINFTKSMFNKMNLPELNFFLPMIKVTNSTSLSTMMILDLP